MSSLYLKLPGHTGLVSRSHDLLSSSLKNDPKLLHKNPINVLMRIQDYH